MAEHEGIAVPARAPRRMEELAMDWLHRAVSGQTISSKELRIAGVFVIVWFLMDFVQWLDWLREKLASFGH
jgi:UDP-N-acetyl-D-mannosaminuronic acid transferase (WecB/TagA/CpsF family)